MKDSFPTAMKFIFVWEGGYVNNPNDPGGETCYGISKRAHPDENIKDMTRDRASWIYRNKYWYPIGCDDLCAPDDIAVFDTAVVCGVYRAKRWYWREGDWRKLLDARRTHHNTIATKHPPLKMFLRGWLNRLGALQELCEKIERDNPPPL